MNPRLFQKLRGAFCLLWVFAGFSLHAATFNAGSEYTALPLLVGKQNQLVLRVPMQQGKASIALDTGSPVTCVDESKSKLFNLKSTAVGGKSPTSVMVNGVRHRIATVPSLQLGHIEVQGMPVVLIDFTDLNKMLHSRRDLQNDAIMGLDTLHALKAVIDCGGKRLLLRNSSKGTSTLGSRLRRAGWTEIPMRMDDGGHMIVAGTVQRAPLDLIVDTGSPISVLDQAFCRTHKVTLTNSAFGLKAIHFETEKARIGKVSQFRVGRLDLGLTNVAVFDVTMLLRGHSGTERGIPAGLLGSRTMIRTNAFIDCENMNLYLKVPSASREWNF